MAFEICHATNIQSGMRSLLSPVEVLHLIQSTVADQRVSIELVYGFDPLPVSSSDEKSFGFQIIKKTIVDLFPTVTVAPGRTSAGYEMLHVRSLTRVYLHL